MRQLNAAIDRRHDDGQRQRRCQYPDAECTHGHGCLHAGADPGRLRHQQSLSLDGTGQTIAIVDAYDDPSIFQALDAFDAQFGLTASGPTLYNQYGPASSFLTVLNQYGQATSLPSTDPNGPGTDNWEVEEALDVEWAHAIAPGPRSSSSKPTASRSRT